MKRRGGLQFRGRDPDGRRLAGVLADVFVGDAHVHAFA